MIMGSWYKHFLIKNPIYASKIRISVLYKYLPILKAFKPLLQIIFKVVENLCQKNLPNNNFSYLLFEFYFKYANILGMMSEPINNV